MPIPPLLWRPPSPAIDPGAPSVTRLRRATFALPTSGSEVTYTIPEMLGLTPVAARFIAIQEENTGGQRDNACFSFGFTDGVNQLCAAMFSEDGGTAFNCGHDACNDRCVWLPLGDGSGSMCELSIKSFGPGSVTLNVDKPAADPDLLIGITLIVCNGAEVIEFDGAALAGDYKRVPVNGTPSIMEFIYPAQTFKPSASVTLSPNMQWGYAVASFDGSTITQNGVWRYELDGGFGGRAKDAMYVSDSSRMITQTQIIAGLATLDTSHLITAVNNRRIRVTTLDASNVLSAGFLSLNLDNAEGLVGFGSGMGDTPTSTGEHVLATSVKPQYASWLATYMRSVGLRDDGDTSCYAWGGCDIDGGYDTLGGRNQDNRTTSRATSWARDTALAMRNNFQTPVIEASFVSMDGGGSPGIRLDWTSVDGTARKYPYWWVEDIPYSPPVEEDIRSCQHIGVASPAVDPAQPTPYGILGAAQPEAEQGVADPRKLLGTP